MRLDKFIAHCSGASRNQVKRWLRAKRVSVAGATATDPSQIITTAQRVQLDNKLLQYPSARYFMLNKPAGVVCSNTDSDNPTVLEQLKGIDTQGLQIAGRLDKDTTGLVLLTDDGQWNHQITAPRAAKDKVYLASLAEPISQQCIDQFAAGLPLKNDAKNTLPAQLEPITERLARVTLHEGRYHQVKRMFAACGNHVVALHRESVAGIVLDPALAPGDYRALTVKEIAQTQNTKTKP